MLTIKSIRQLTCLPDLYHTPSVPQRAYRWHARSRAAFGKNNLTFHRNKHPRPSCKEKPKRIVSFFFFLAGARGVNGSAIRAAGVTVKYVTLETKRRWP